MPEFEVRGAIIREAPFRYVIWADDEEQATARVKKNAFDFGEWNPETEIVQVETVREVN